MRSYTYVKPSLNQSPKSDQFELVKNHDKNTTRLSHGQIGSRDRK